MKKIEQPSHIIYSIILFVLSIISFLYFETLIWKILVSFILFFLGIGNFLIAFEKKKLDVPKNIDSQEITEFEDLNDTDKETVREVLQKNIKTGFKNLANKRFELIIECQKCNHNEKFGFMNQNAYSKLYSTNEVEIYNKENTKYPLLCFKCNHVTFYSPNGTAIEMDNTISYFEVIKLNQNIKNHFVKHASDNNYYEKLKMIKSIDL